jgi:uncharacterized coiled-coil DUF342 family protein
MYTNYEKELINEKMTLEERLNAEIAKTDQMKIEAEQMKIRITNLENFEAEAKNKFKQVDGRLNDLEEVLNKADDEYYAINPNEDPN